ncbi:MAG: class I SAM-dependent methyltransferase [Planctomycetes bacterium]|nr:class I SAM-dependent methyltransferase [Planctomycetota bacterium]
MIQTLSAPRQGVVSECDWPCPLCGGDSVWRFAKDAIGIRDCQECGHRFAELKVEQDHASRHYGDDYFQGGGAGYSNYFSEERLLRAHGRRYARLFRRHSRPGKILDVGSAAGFILNGFAERGWQCTGIEPNDRMAAHARQQLGLDVRTGTLESITEVNAFDAVSMIQVVAHFADPMAAFEAAARATKPGGVWLIETWNLASVTARVFGRNWHEYSPPTVLHWFTPRTLSFALSCFGMRRVAIGKPAKWLDGEHAKGLVRHKLGVSHLGRLAKACLGLVPDRLPIPYPSEDLFWAVFRKESAR